MWPLIVLAASAFLNAKNQSDARDRQNQFANAMQQYQLSKAREQTAATQQYLTKETPQARAGELDVLTAERAKSLTDTVAAAQPTNAPRIAGKLSGDYQASQDAAAERVADRNRRAIANLSVMGAPAAQELGTGLRFGRAAGTVDAASQASANVGRGYGVDIGNVHPNPYLDVISRIGMAVGGAGLGQAWAAPEATAAAESSGFAGDPGNLAAGEWKNMATGETGLTMRGLKNKWANAWGLYGQPTRTGGY